jgi:hypothetical protein
MNEPHHQQHELGPEPAAPDLVAGHEVSDVSIRGLVTFLVGLVVSLAVVVLAIAWMFVLLVRRANEADPPESPVAKLREAGPPSPHLQQSPAFDMRVMREEQTAALKRTRWIDKEAQVVQIPVQRAIELVAERGLPDWPRADVKPPPGKDNKQDGRPDDVPGAGKNADAKSRDPGREKQPSDVSPAKNGQSKKPGEDES